MRNLYDIRPFKELDAFFVGLDKIADKLDAAQNQARSVSAKYPPYNLKKIDENKYTIELAVAGFAKQDLDVELADNNLTIKGNIKSGEPAELASNGEWTWPQVIYQGLAMRSFTRSFRLADNVELVSASLINGILKIVLDTIVPEHKKPRKIEIWDDAENNQ